MIAAAFGRTLTPEQTRAPGASYIPRCTQAVQRLQQLRPQQP